MKGSAGRPAFRVSAMRRGRCRRCQERDDRQQLAGDAEIVRHELGAGNDETTGDLRDKQAEQAEIGVAVDIAGDETQEHWHRQRQGLVAPRDCFGHGEAPHSRHSGFLAGSDSSRCDRRREAIAPLV